ncbi:MAG: glucose-6-phosphate isomerase family protein [Anaerolineales bacterium]|uniref:glucose-6-phosphate isomerase family protein n=1 Tax=Candidatus Hadarchaeum sp. TaxID=2883567 RepID=UPI003CA62822
MGNIFKFSLSNGVIQGARRWERKLSDMVEVFASQNMVAELLRLSDPVIYEVYEVEGIPEKTGELIWSSTVLYPGKVGQEYYMTKGHYHRDPNCAEIYLVLSGKGFLLLRGPDGSKAVPVEQDSLVYIPPGYAHRMVNCGDDPLIFFAVYPAQAGHDYERVKREGLGLRVIEGPSGPEVRPCL